MLALVLALTLAVQSNPAAQTRDTRTWYQAYADAQQNVQRRNWQAALNDLDAAARLGAPRPGRNVNFYGDVYRDYNPDYYRGVALASLERYQEADQAFERVRQAGLITQRDNLFAEFNRQSTTAKEGIQRLAEARPPAVNPAAQTPARGGAAAQAGAATTGVSPAGVTPQGVNASGVNTAGIQAPPATAPSPATSPAQVDPRNINPASVNTANANPANAAVQRPLTPEEQKEPAVRTAPPPARVPPRTTTNARATPAAQAPPAMARVDTGLLLQRDSLLLYYSGNYARARLGFEQLAREPGAYGRVYLYLAASQAAMVLTGQAPRSDLDEARRVLAQAGALTPFARDLELISPRVRQELGIRQ